MRQYWTQARLKTLIVLLILAALVDSYALARSFAARNADSERIGMTGPAYAYQYTITFVIQGITAESVTHDSQECFWRTTVLGLPHTIWGSHHISG